MSKGKKRLSELDPESSEYWDKVLLDHGLGVERGRNTSKVSLRGDLNDLVKTETAMAEKRVYGGRKVKPTGAQPE